MIRKVLSILLIPLFVFAEDDKTIFLGTFIGSYDKLTSPFLKTIEQLDYDKKKITLQINVLNNDPLVVETVKNWEIQNQDKYSKIVCMYEPLDLRLDAALLYSHPEKKSSLLGEIKNDFLKKTKEYQCDYCFIIDSDVFLVPLTLKQLISKEKPIITPVLRPIPGIDDPFCNFFSTTNEEGFQNNECQFFSKTNRDGFYSNYLTAVDRMVAHKGKTEIIQTGTVVAASAFGAYLIESKHIDKLSFKDSILSEDFFAFARSSKKNKIEHYVSNEKEFGSFIHFQDPLSREEEKEFCLIGSETEVNATYIQNTFSNYLEQDLDLKNYLASTFSIKNYSLYRVENRDLFYVDDTPDFIKNLYIKRGKPWEKHIQQILKKYTREGTVAIDIGGHMGNHALSLSKFVGANGTVHVFEPQLKLFCELVINMSLNQCKNIVFHRMALGNEDKQVSLSSPCVNNEGMCRIISSNEEGVKAPMKKLDHLQLSNVSIIKIDVEGFEKEVLQGAKETILKNHPVLIMELSGSETELKEKKDLIENFGYQIFFLGKEDYLCLPKK